METLLVVRKADAKKRVFNGVHLDSLAVGEKGMVCKMNYQDGGFAAEHQHPHEQCGHVISGKYELTVKDGKWILVGGDCYAIPGNTLYLFKALKAEEVIDVFTPRREDYM